MRSIPPLFRQVWGRLFTRGGLVNCLVPIPNRPQVDNLPDGRILQ